MRIRKTTALTALLTFALTAIILVGTTLAYLTDTDKTTNVTYAFNANDIAVELEEPIWDAQKDGEYFDGDAALMTPGRKLVKDPQITVLEDSADCFVRLRVEVDANLKEIIDYPIAPGSGPVVNWSFVDKGLQKDGDRSYYLLYYYYPVQLSAGATTPSAFDHVRIKRKEELDGLGLGLLEEMKNDKDQKLNITIWGEVIQAFGFTSYNEAMKALEVASGNWTSEGLPEGE